MVCFASVFFTLPFFLLSWLIRISPHNWPFQFVVLASFLCSNSGKTAECNGMACTKMVNIVLCSSTHLMLL